MPRNIPWQEIERTMYQLQDSSEEWRAIKLVVLGNGRIGKTTLLKALKQSLNIDTPRRVIKCYIENALLNISHKIIVNYCK